MKNDVQDIPQEALDKIYRLEKRLRKAKKTIRRLKIELEEARDSVTVVSEGPPADAGGIILRNVIPGTA